MHSCLFFLSVNQQMDSPISIDSYLNITKVYATLLSQASSAHYINITLFVPFALVSALTSFEATLGNICQTMVKVHHKFNKRSGMTRPRY